ncbi:hypothetical protein ABTF50_20325, partial [Acinetobacter baumannii]
FHTQLRGHGRRIFIGHGDLCGGHLTQTGIGSEAGDGVVNQGDRLAGGGEAGTIDTEALIHGFFQLFEALQAVLGIGQHGFIEGM